MMVVEIFSRTKRLSEFPPNVILEMLSFSNKFCCEEMKHACETHLASLVLNMDDVVLLIEYGLEDTTYLLVAACLQVFLRELPVCIAILELPSFALPLYNKQLTPRPKAEASNNTWRRRSLGPELVQPPPWWETLVLQASNNLLYPTSAGSCGFTQRREKEHVKQRMVQATSSLELSVTVLAG
ncbi:hypothetical protein VIGAN_07201400 [Vigna angularis var. angularis]|uniref:Uncharacterized protein n=1 Tax=Vigna angularis var. angularis TaxID=157739 RepID=A0A0S3SK38_PHAAN|nr:hypothetical protein VIGAN_07201400 [Vigna angularis var. angularis]